MDTGDKWASSNIILSSLVLRRAGVAGSGWVTFKVVDELSDLEGVDCDVVLPFRLALYMLMGPPPPRVVMVESQVLTDAGFQRVSEFFTA